MRHTKPGHEYVVTAHFVQHFVIEAHDVDHARTKAERQLASLAAGRSFEITEIEQTA